MDGTGVLVPEAGEKSLLGLNGKPLEFRELRCFLSVARTGNFGRSARELNIGQPAITHQMQKLEASLGAQLLVRHGRGVTLTRAGTFLRNRIDQVMQLLAAPLEEDVEHVAAPDGPVKLAVPAELGPLLMAPLLEQFRLLWPNAVLDIQDGSGSQLEEWVLSRRVDIAVVQDSATIPDIETRLVLSETLGLVSSARSPVSDYTGPMTLREIAALPLILPGTEHWIRRRLDRAAFQAGIPLTPTLQVDSVALTKAMVRNGLGSTVLPGTAVQDELSRGVLSFRPIVRPSLSATHAIAWRRASPSRAVLDLARLLHEAMVSLVESGAWSGAQVISSGTGPGISTEEAAARMA
jgi:LysR family nitrogen assimilation transcriptional regulator